VHVGNIYSSDTFYDERDDLTAIMQRHGVLCGRDGGGGACILSPRAISVRALADPDNIRPSVDA
jgi:hypothetical protein